MSYTRRTNVEENIPRVGQIPNTCMEYRKAIQKQYRNSSIQNRTCFYVTRSTSNLDQVASCRREIIRDATRFVPSRYLYFAPDASQPELMRCATNQIYCCILRHVLYMNTLRYGPSPSDSYMAMRGWKGSSPAQQVAPKTQQNGTRSFLQRLSNPSNSFLRGTVYNNSSIYPQSMRNSHRPKTPSIPQVPNSPQSFYDTASLPLYQTLNPKPKPSNTPSSAPKKSIYTNNEPERNTSELPSARPSSPLTPHHVTPFRPPSLNSRASSCLLLARDQGVIFSLGRGEER